MHFSLPSMFGSSSQLPTTVKHVVIKSLCTVQTTKQYSAVVGSREEPPNYWLMVAKNVLVGFCFDFESPVLLKGTVTLTVEKANTLVITLQTFSWFLLSNSTLAGWSSASWPFRVAHSVFFSSNFLFSSSTFSATSSCRPSLDEVLLSSTFCFFAAQIDDHSASLLPCSAIKTSKGSLDTLGLGNCWSFGCRSNKQRVTFDMIEAFENMHNKLDLNDFRVEYALSIALTV